MNSVHFLNQLATTQCAYNFGAGIPPIDVYPSFDEHHCIKEFLNTYPQAPIKDYHHTEGFLGEIGAKFFANDGFESANSSNVIVTNGVQEAITVACWMFKENTIACIDPFYPGLVDVVKLTGKQPAFFNQNNWLNTLNTLPKGSLFYLSADFANPTGNCLSIDERLHLVNTARERDFYIFDDATYRPFNLTKALPSLVSLAPDRVFHAQSFSKVLAPGLRIAFIHVPESFKNGFLTIKAILSLNSPGTTQAIVGGWLILNDFKFQKHLEGFKEELKHKKAILGKQGINYSGGFFAELHFEGVTIDYNWCASLLAVEGVAVCPMQMFSKQKSFQHSLRVAIARISITILEEGLMKIHKFTQS